MARLKISDVLNGGMQGLYTGATSGLLGSAGLASPAAPWILGGGAAMGALSSILGDSETESERLSNMLANEKLTNAKMVNADMARQQREQRKLDARNKVMSNKLAGFMRGANLARKMI